MEEKKTRRIRMQVNGKCKVNYLLIKKEAENTRLRRILKR